MPAQSYAYQPLLNSSPTSDGRRESYGALASTSPHLCSHRDGDTHSDEVVEAKLCRGLKERHIQMMSVAGIIGTGLFLSSGRALADAGPVGSLIAYSLMGLVTGAVAYTSGEMSALMPVSGGFVRHVTRFVDPTLGAITGWNFWYSMAITQSVEIVAASILASFWFPDVNVAVWISVFWVLIVLINLTPVRWYGEVEFSFAIIKISLILGLLLLGLVINLGGAPNRVRLGFKYWYDPGPFQQLSYGDGQVVPGLVGRLLAIFQVLTNAAFAFGNVQIVGIAGCETRNPRKAIPLAVSRTFIRIVVFYLASIFLIGINLPSTHPGLRDTGGTAAQSPFVIAAREAGINTLPSVINAVVLTSAFSSGVSCVFISSRTLVGLSQDGSASKLFSTVNRFGTPYISVLLTSSLGICAYLSVTQTTFKALIWLINLSALAGLIGWIVLCLGFLRMRDAMDVQGYSVSDLPYSVRGQPYIAWFALVCCVIVVVFSGFTNFLPGNWSLAGFLSSYISLILFISTYLFLKLRDCHGLRQRTHKGWFIPASQIDLSEFENVKRERMEEGGVDLMAQFERECEVDGGGGGGGDDRRRERRKSWLERVGDKVF